MYWAGQWHASVGIGSGKARSGRQLIGIPSESWRIHKNPLLKLYELDWNGLNWFIIELTVCPRFGLEFGALIFLIYINLYTWNMKHAGFMKFSTNSWHLKWRCEPQIWSSPAISQRNESSVLLWTKSVPSSQLGICWRRCGLATESVCPPVLGGEV